MIFDKNLLYLEIIFLAGVIISFLVEGNIFLKLLILIILFLFIIKEKDQYRYNLNKYLFISYGLLVILFLIYLVEYITHIYYLVFVICIVVIYFYLYKTLFNTTYGVIVSSTTKNAKVKILDSFYKFNKIYTIPVNRKLIKDKKVIIKLSSFPINKKPEKIIRILK
jgi:hypothetical protein